MNNRSKWCSVFLYPYIWIKVISVIPYQKRMSTGPSSPTVCARYVFWYDESRVRHLWQYACRWCLCHVTGGLITNIINWLQFFSWYPGFYGLNALLKSHPNNVITLFQELFFFFFCKFPLWQKLNRKGRRLKRVPYHQSKPDNSLAWGWINYIFMLACQI